MNSKDAITTSVADSPTRVKAQPLHRELGGVGVLLLTLSALSPAGSVFIAGASVAHSAGTGVALGFLAGGVIAAVLAMLYAELGASFPHAGGSYPSVAGTLGSGAGFVMLALSVALSPAFLAFTALGFANYVHFLVPRASQLSIGLAAIAAGTMISVLNLRTNTWITGTFLAVELLAVLALSFVGLAQPVRSLGEIILHPVMPSVGAGQELVPTPFGAMALAIVAGAWACSGAAWALFFGEELHDAHRRLGGVVVKAGVVAGALISVPLVLFAIGAGDLQDMLAADAPFAAFITTTAGPRIGTLASLGVAIAIFNSIIVSTIASSRGYYANARDGVFPRPINWALTRTHSRFKSPWIAALSLGGLGAAYCLMGQRMNILLLSGEVYGGALVAISVLVGRRRGLTGRIGFRTPLYPAIPIFGLLVAAAFVVATYADADAGRPSMMILLGVVACAVVYYALVLRPKGWRVHTPLDDSPRT